MKRIGIMDGTFNPVHNAHLMIANDVMCQRHLDRIVFMPDNQPPEIRPKHAINVRDRIKMLKLAIANNPRFSVSTLEAQRSGKSHTFDTACQLRKLYPDVKWSWIIGGDEVATLSTWKHIDKLVQMIQFVGVARNGSKMESKYPIIWAKIPRFDISSGMIRQRIRNHQTIRYLVPDSVRKYIYKNHLYLN